MARFKGKAASRPDVIVPVILGITVLLTVAFLIWYIVNPTAFTNHWRI